MPVGPDRAVSPFGHVGAPDQDRPRPAQTGDGRRVTCGRRILCQHGRSRAGDLAGNVEQILDRDRDASQGPEMCRRHARPTAVVVGDGLRRRCGGIGFAKHQSAFARRIVAVDQHLLHQRLAGQPTGIECKAQFSNRLCHRFIRS